MLVFLSMFTDDVEGLSIDKNNFTVTRINHNFSKSRSSIGGAYISRSGLGDNSHDYNRVIAVDGIWGIGKKAKLQVLFQKVILQVLNRIIMHFNFLLIMIGIFGN